MHRNRFWIAILTACHLVVLPSVPSVAQSPKPGQVQVGWASWYGAAHHGRKTASGERFSMREMTAAHRKLPLGTKVLVKHLETGRQAEVKITDRGPYGKDQHRIIDLSRAAAEHIGIQAQGVGRVEVVVTELPSPRVGSKATNGYVVQVGAFAARERAQTLLAQVKARYSETYVARRQGPRGPYYRVRVGPFEERAQAQRVASALQREGYGVFVDELAS